MRFIFLLTFILTINSCASTKLIPDDRRISLNPDNISMVSGRYDNNSTDTIHWKQTTFWGHLRPFPNDSNLNQTANLKIPNSVIDLRIVDNKKIRFDLYDSIEIRESKIFRYYNKDGIILIRSSANKRWRGIPLLFFHQHSETLNLALDQNSNLVLSYDGTASGGVFILIFGAAIRGTHTFKKK